MVGRERTQVECRLERFLFWFEHVGHGGCELVKDIGVRGAEVEGGGRWEEGGGRRPQEGGVATVFQKQYQYSVPLLHIL